MLKIVVAGVTALAIAGGSLVYAQQRGDGAGHGMRWRPSAEDISAFSDARIAALKAGLKLTPEQEKNWPALEQAMRDSAKQRAERFAARASADRPRDPIERMRLGAEVMTQMGANLKKVADAAAPLYQSLDQAQKQRFVVLARLDAQRFGHHWHHRGPDGRGMRGPGGPDGVAPAPDGAPRQQ